MSDRFVGAFGSTLTLGGALAVGAVLHAAVVEGTLPPFGPVAVLGLAGGVALVVVGHRVESASGDATDGGDGKETGDSGAGDEAEYDPEMAPVDESALDGYERDDDYER